MVHDNKVQISQSFFMTQTPLQMGLISRGNDDMFKKVFFN